MEEWIPKTELGRKVKEKEIVDIKQVLFSGKKILEPEIVDLLVPNLEEEVLEINLVQRMTDSGRRSRYQVLVVVGNRDGIVGVGLGKDVEIRKAIEKAVRDAKLNIIYVWRGCGSWECGCGEPHSIPVKVKGKEGSVEITLKPAPKGVGLVAGSVAKKILALAGIKDIWSFSRGQTSTKVNTARAVINALNQMNEMRFPPEFRAKMK